MKDWLLFLSSSLTLVDCCIIVQISQCVTDQPVLTRLTSSHDGEPIGPIHRSTSWSSFLSTMAMGGYHSAGVPRQVMSIKDFKIIWYIPLCFLEGRSYSEQLYDVGAGGFRCLIADT